MIRWLTADDNNSLEINNYISKKVLIYSVYPYYFQGVLAEICDNNIFHIKSTPYRMLAFHQTQVLLITKLDSYLIINPQIIKYLNSTLPLKYRIRILI